jgi:hypothetical protein
MNRQREYIGFIVKRTLGTVAMMHISIKHRDAPNLTQCPRTLYRDGSIAQQTNPPPGCQRYKARNRLRLRHPEGRLFQVRPDNARYGNTRDPRE